MSGKSFKLAKVIKQGVDRAIERLLPHFHGARLKSLTTIIQSSIITMNTNFSIYSFLLFMEIEFAIGVPALWHNPHNAITSL